MKIGTKSILFGSHQFLIHPWFVAWAWWKLYGFPFDPRLWVAFFVHDLGYLGKPNMDGPEGERHVELGARIMSRLFDKGFPRKYRMMDDYHGGWAGLYKEYGEWGNFSLLHSRFYAKKLQQPPSRLCFADKLAIVLTPSWLYVPMARWTGELYEYMEKSAPREATMPGEAAQKYAHMNVYAEDPYLWHQNVKNYLVGWLAQSKYGQPDTITPPPEAA